MCIRDRSSPKSLQALSAVSCAPYSRRHPQKVPLAPCKDELCVCVCVFQLAFTCGRVRMQVVGGQGQALPQGALAHPTLRLGGRT
eukprot:11914872-Alexandrium_andersonii.AAC.1